ncbi:hypothetical protein V6Z11_A05G307600 [Gossypium hirsutum]
MSSSFWPFQFLVLALFGRIVELWFRFLENIVRLIFLRQLVSFRIFSAIRVISKFRIGRCAGAHMVLSVN